jgi:CRP-like cAMP-binding protein
MSGRQSEFRNKLLQKMDAADFELLAPSLREVRLDVRRDLERPNAPVENVYFFESGLASIVARMSGGRDIEVGIAGRDGMTGTAVVLGGMQTPNSTFMQVAGSGWSMPAREFRDALEKRPSLRDLMLRYVQAMMVQTTSTALANGQAKLEERLARWLLMTHDRIDGSDVRLTHEFLAVMLGVRRPGVTLAIHILEGKGLIRAHRGQLVIMDREGLEAHANGSYGTAEAEYDRLIG